MNKAHSVAGDPTMDLAGYKNELTLEVMHENGQLALRYFLHTYWISDYIATSDLGANAVANERPANP